MIITGQRLLLGSDDYHYVWLSVRMIITTYDYHYVWSSLQCSDCYRGRQLCRGRVRQCQRSLACVAFSIGSTALDHHLSTFICYRSFLITIYRHSQQLCQPTITINRHSSVEFHWKFIAERFGHGPRFGVRFGRWPRLFVASPLRSSVLPCLRSSFAFVSSATRSCHVKITRRLLADDY